MRTRYRLEEQRLLDLRRSLHDAAPLLAHALEIAEDVMKGQLHEDHLCHLREAEHLLRNAARAAIWLC